MPHNVFLVPSPCIDNVTLLSIESAYLICVFFICKYILNLSQKIECSIRYTSYLVEPYIRERTHQ